MAELSKEERWRKLQEDLERPVKLSEAEKEKLRSIFKEVHELLDENLEAILKADRDNAYRYANLLIQAFNQANVDYAQGVEAEERKAPSAVNLEPPTTKEPTVMRVELGERPNFHGILNQLTEEEGRKAVALLDCVKTGLDIELDGGDPSDALCYGLDRVCSAEEMRKCIRTEDPTVLDEMDRDLQNKRRAG